MKINVDYELEKAHQASVLEREGILYDLYALDKALLYCYKEEKLTQEEFEEFDKILNKTYRFIKEGERI